jgi:hypothetical protein
VAFGGDLAGRIFECRGGVAPPVAAFSVGSGPRATQRDAPRAAAATTLAYSANGQFLLSGADDGGVTVRQAGRSTAGAPLERCFLRLQPHDGDAGEVTGAALSFDHKFLLSAARDGGWRGACEKLRGRIRGAQARAKTGHQNTRKKKNNNMSACIFPF